MRVTSNMLINKMMYSLNSNLSRMSKIQTQLSTGKKINLPSDDPLIASKSLKLRTDISEIEQHVKNVDDGLSWTEITDSTLSTIGDVVQRARELSVQATTGTLDSNQRININEEVKQLYDQLINLGNSTYAGRNIFSGFKTDNALLLSEDGTFNYTDLPVVTDGTNFKLRHEDISAVTNVEGDVAGVPTVFALVAGAPAVGEVQVDSTTGQMTFNAIDVGAGITGANATYSVDRLRGEYNPDVYSYSSISQTAPMQGENIQFEVGVGNKIDVNVIGTKIFGLVSGAGNTGDNMVAFQDLVTALATNDTSGIENAITDLDEFMNSVLEQRADVGARANRFELTQNRLSNQLINITDLMSKNEDADMAEVIMNLKNEENVYKASLDIGARIIQPTLMDYLR